MAYCPECGGEVLGESVLYCYRCGEQLKGMNPADLEDGEVFEAMMEALLDSEISSATSGFVEELSTPGGDAAPSVPRMERTVRHITTYANGFGKGLAKMMLLDLEADDNDVEYTDEDYTTAYRWVFETVESREEYIRAALEGEDE